MISEDIALLLSFLVVRTTRKRKTISIFKCDNCPHLPYRLGLYPEMVTQIRRIKKILTEGKKMIPEIRIARKSVAL